MNTTINVDLSEVDKFNKLASEWWDKTGAFATLHHINPLRLNWIEENVKRGYQSSHQNPDADKTAETGLAGKKIIDVGCGGGILAESMARRGADVTGIDLGTENLKAASLHAEQSDLNDVLRYQHIPVEDLAKAHAGQFDVVTCMEMLEHVPDPSAIVQACYDLLAPGGVCSLPLTVILSPTCLPSLGQSMSCAYWIAVPMTMQNLSLQLSWTKWQLMQDLLVKT